MDGIWSSASEMAMVDVEADALGGRNAYAVHNLDGTSRVGMTRVRATAHASGGRNAYGVYNLETRVDLRDCEVLATGATIGNWAVYAKRSDLRVYRSSLTASGTAPTTALTTSDADPGGTGSTGPWTVLVHASQLWGQTTVVDNSTSFDTRIGASWLGGGGNISNNGTLVCAGVYDDAFTFLPDTCQEVLP